MKMLVVCGALLFALPLSAHWNLKGYTWAVIVDDDLMAVGTNNRSERRVERLRSKYDEPFIWVRHDGAEWIITDARIVRQLHELMKEPRDLREAHLGVEEQSRLIEESMRAFERRVAEIGRRVEAETLDETLSAALEIAEAAKELRTEDLDAAAERLQESAGYLERWAEELEKRFEEEAVPLIEDAIRTGKAKRLK